jgi:hypothetical protein
MLTKSKPKKRKQKTLSQLKKKLWELCKQIIRARDGSICFICGQSGLEGSNWHTGHFIPSSTCGAYLRYDLRNLHSSCYNCNINCGGNGALFYRRLVEVYGQAFVDRIFNDQKICIKANKVFYEEKIEKYTEISGWDQVRILDHTRIHAQGSSAESHMPMCVRQNQGVQPVEHSA